MILGIDPSLRHTGVTLLSGDSLVVFTGEVKTTDAAILTSTRALRRDLQKVFSEVKKLAPGGLDFSMEQMMPTASSGALLFHVQMLILESIEDTFGRVMIHHPLPVQLKSYIKKVSKGPIESKTDIVNSFRELSGVQGRVSSHIADAYFLARLGQDVSRGRFAFKPPSKGYKLMDW